MSTIDWIVLLGTLAFIVIYGVWKTRGSKNLESYLKGDNDAKWWGIGISIMATQASAITFLSTPGQAYTDGMQFLQFYFGLPIAMIILSVTFIPIFYKLKVFTAYEFLESRFDLKTRSLAAILFLVQRGLAAGITIYAPAIILSTLLGWNLGLTNVFIGVLVIAYTVSGGTKAVTQTQKQQMAVMMGGMILAGIMVISMLPQDIRFSDALHVAGKMEKLNVVNFNFDFNDRYNFWSGITAALFLFMSYFGTDQSQVQRYLTGKSIRESRLGLMMNGLLKVPMQFIILFIGVMVFVFYQFNQPPIFFNKVQKQNVEQSVYADDFKAIEEEYTAVFEQKKEALKLMVAAVNSEDEKGVDENKTKAMNLQTRVNELREETKALVLRVDPKAETNDKDYIFMTYVMDYLPIGMIGLLFAVMFSAAMSSTASELNALASTTTIDLYKRSINKKADETHYLKSSKWFTFLWGALAILFATTASLFENLIQAVNYLGSIFYGTILGIFVVAFYAKKIKGNAVFVAALLAEISVITIDLLNRYEMAPNWLQMGYLWYNVVGCLLVVIFGYIIQAIIKK
ncbi:sodium:solute symporter [Vicingus serpentipes]|uniref:Sodium:solute symporter n=1 Tax=Vicingus serpentipes TaxID=1926625 RepID=A0A5C6RVD9_9FLAO|nr:sodium:solute symporter [Vicingus serpentipes]TXB66014.1 sodium:solute symporter [Vicingus serpentipes]